MLRGSISRCDNRTQIIRRSLFLPETVKRDPSRSPLERPQVRSLPSNVLPASLRKELLSGAKRAQTARGHNAIPKGLCRYSLHNAIPNKGAVPIQLYG